jgi:single-strand DNA-binding protein
MNKAFIIGRITRDLELKYTTGGTAVTNFTIAVDRYKKGDEQEADFIPIVVYGKTAEACANNLGKGRLIAVSGRIQTRSYEGQNGKRHVTEIIADEVQFLNRPKSDAPAPEEGQDYPEETPF